MTAEPDLLPLPAPDYLLPLGPDHGDISMWSENTIRQIVAHATAAKDAEVEALRAEVALLRVGAENERLHQRVLLDRERERAERHAATLRNIAAMRWSSGDDLMDAAGAARAALDQEAGRG